jgi:hypothetical protein
MEVQWTGGGGHVVEESCQHFVSDGIRVGEVPAEPPAQARTASATGCHAGVCLGGQGGGGS